MALALVVASFAASWLVTGAVRRHALDRSMLDIPNDRSSHDEPTARGGGIAIAGVTLITIALLGVFHFVSTNIVMALAGGGVLIAGIGWIDDRGHVPARFRALVHFAAAIWALVWIGGLEWVRIGGAYLSLGIGGWIIAALGIVWLTNLYNFMDGIDGIAGGEAVSTGVFGAGLLLSAGEGGLAVVSLLIAAASGGFLVWNWPPAKIFMGDVGSGLLGFFFAVIGVASERLDAVPLVVWLLLLGTFVFDSTLTLLRRVAHGEKWYAAHRSHAYQRLVQAGWSHAQVSGSVAGLNLLLGGLAVVSVRRPEVAPIALLVGSATLAILYLMIERYRPMQQAASGNRSGTSDVRSRGQ